MRDLYGETLAAVARGVLGEAVEVRVAAAPPVVPESIRFGSAPPSPASRFVGGERELR